MSSYVQIIRSYSASAQVDEIRHSDIQDKIMREYLGEEGLLPKSAESEAEAKPASKGAG